MRRKTNFQWLVLCLIVTVTISGSFLYRTRPDSVYVVKTTSHTTPASLLLARSNHVTKSLAELGKMDEISKNFLFLNHVPKSGSEILILLLQRMQGLNNYRHIRLKGGNKRKLTKLQEEELVEEFYDILRDQAVPLSFDRHVYFVNFSSYDKQSPTYINLIRDPADKIISRLPLKNGKPMDYFYKCVMKKDSSCNFKDDLSIPYFCGQDPRCMILNDKWALKTAKNNVEKYFEVVGILEELNSTLEVFENKIPRFFRGVQLQNALLLGQFRNKQNSKHKVPNEVRKKLKDTLVTEYEFYEWAKSRLFSQLQIIYGEHQSH